MLDRASSFANPEIVSLLSERFVPVAIDQAYQRRQQDAEGEFYRKIADEGPRPVGDGGPTTQGHYVASPDGTFLGYRNHRDPSVLLDLLNESLAAYVPGNTPAIRMADPDARWNPSPPENGLVVRVASRIMGGYDEPKSDRERIFRSATGRDNLWVKAEEHDALIAGEVPRALAERLARFHLVDNTRGEPPMWSPEEIRTLEISVSGEAVRGSFHLSTESGDREFQGEITGRIESEGGRVTRFDLLVRGFFLGEGQYTRGAPEGRFPLAVAFELADGTDPADAIPPQGSRGWVEGYLE